MKFWVVVIALGKFYKDLARFCSSPEAAEAFAEGFNYAVERCAQDEIQQAYALIELPDQQVSVRGSFKERMSWDNIPAETIAEVEKFLHSQT